jgi:hypothetical protein
MSTLTTEHIAEPPTVDELREAIWYAHLYCHAEQRDRYLDALIEAQQ